MITQPSNDIDLSDDEALAVLIDFADAQEGGGSAARLADWATRYPDLGRDLGRVAEASWSRMDGRASDTTESAARFGDIGRAALRAALPGYTPAAPLISLLQEAKTCGLSKNEFAAALSVPDTLLLKLHRRLIDAATVPAALIEKAADAINRTVDEVAAYLQMPAQMPLAASFRADSAPQAKTESFIHALASDPETLPEHKAAWLDKQNGGAA